MHSVSIGAAFLAGLASFLSPCVLPLVPGYISFMSGLSLEEISSGAATTRRTALAALFFVLGFSVVFTALGASASFIGQLLAAHLSLLGKVAGALIIVLGLHTTGLVPIKWLYYTKRADSSRVAPGLAGSFLMGLAFAFGWTPCIGPILAAILAVAASKDTVAKGAILLAVYSAGLGIPFLLAAFAVEPMAAFISRFKRHLDLVEKVMGGLLVLTGIAFLTGFVTEASFWLLEWFPALGRIG